MNLALPILAYDCVYNRETTENKAFYWKNIEELRQYLFNPIDTTIGLKMKEIANNRYTWKIIAEKYSRLY